MKYSERQVLNAIKNGINKRQLLVGVIPTRTLDYNLAKFVSSGFILKEVVNREAIYSITTRGVAALNEFRDFSGIEITHTPSELVEIFNKELIRQVILKDKILQDIIVTIPFCYGRLGRNSAGVTANMISSAGRGKTMISKIWQEIAENPSYVDCKDIFGGPGIETRFKNAVESNPDIMVVDEVSQLMGSKLAALQSHTREHIYPLVMIGNPSSKKADYKSDTFHGWLQSVYDGGNHVARSFMDRINLFIYLEKLTQKDDNGQLIDIFFDTNMVDLSEFGAYVKQQKHKNPLPSKEASEMFKEMVLKIREYVDDNTNLTLPRTSGAESPQVLKISHFTGGENMARFQISLMILARGMALRDDSSEIKPEYFETAFDWYFYFLDQIYKIRMRRKVGL